MAMLIPMMSVQLCDTMLVTSSMSVGELQLGSLVHRRQHSLALKHGALGQGNPHAAAGE